MTEQVTVSSLSPQRVGGEVRQERADIGELVGRIATALPEDGRLEPLPGLHLYRSASTRERLESVSEPAFCVIAQGSKEVFLGDERYHYDTAHYLLVTAALPTVGQVLEATKERPYLSLRLVLEPTLVSSIMLEADYPAQKSRANVRAINVSALEPGLLDAALRLMRLLDTPKDAPFLAPLIAREIVYRLLQGEQGERLRHIAVSNGETHRVIKAIGRIRENFDQLLNMESVAQELGMSVSSFYHHFKAVTAMSPLQFQKRLRLQEAKRLMLGEDLGAASAGYRVGYEDASHFNRDYKRHFGRPPVRDVRRLVEAAEPAGAEAAD